ncbi:MAG: transglutaminase-like domain-containing protein [Treponema sp.]|nr:transglutaminase-like domain-containing protein [Treponema sp.]
MNKKLSLFLAIGLILSANLFAQNGISLRVAPAFEAPFGLEHINPGVGASASLDWAFLNFAKNFNFGVSAGGTISSLPMNIGDPLIVMEGKGGLFLQWRPFDRWAFRAAAYGGAYQYSRNEDSNTNLLISGSLGAEFYLSPYFSLFADAGYTYRVFSAEPLSSFSAAIGVKVNLSEIMSGRTRIKIEKTQQHRVFPVSWAWYENNPVATVRITNEEPNAITNVNLSFFMDSYMSQPWTFAVLPHLSSGESIEVPVTALFNEAMLNLTENVNANGVLQLQYRSLGSRKESTSSLQMPIYHRNTLSWDDDRRAAAFVSPKDSAARLFARFVAAGIEASTAQQSAAIPSNVRYATALFEALRLYGITYVIVPATSFARVAADESVLDNVSYPYQALYYRGGDCSYLSILFCSMLEALDIESAFITIPGHIYVAFEVGDDFWYAYSDDIIELEGKRWLPLEITIPGEGFTRAWRVGARQWRTAGDKAALYSIRDSWKVYPSVTVPASGDHLPEMPEWDTIVRAMEREAGIFRWSDAARAAAERRRAANP